MIQRTTTFPNHPLAEIFGFPVDNFSSEAIQCRNKHLCPFLGMARCTKDKARNPLGVCSIYNKSDRGIAIICPIRFRQESVIFNNAAAFFFPKGSKWSSASEVRLNDKNGKSSGNIDIVLIAYNEEKKVIDFGALEIQAVYISGNIRKPFQVYMKDPENKYNTDLGIKHNFPKPDYLSSSRKRLVPQLIFKGGILKGWNKKTAVVIHRGFYNGLPLLPKTSQAEADIAWMIYDLNYLEDQKIFALTNTETIYTKLESAVEAITISDGGSVDDFINVLQRKLTENLGEEKR
jgi:hypothetical protein